ncbi:MAG: DUF4280 domain-containing protein [Lachnospiraceae bacterium]|nr:DUF4280 domain-containing protein [Lachnospiraceae bacterium]
MNIGDFTFDNYKEKNYDKNKEEAIELMCRHFEFYEQLNSPDIEYVTRGAKLSCTHGNKYIYLDAVKDHGVYDGDNPVLICRDCKLKENIYDFGACGNGKFEPLYSEEAPHPAETALNQKGQKRYVCRPILLGEWGHGDINSRSLLIGEVYIDKEYKVYEKESVNDGKPSEYISHCINTIESQNKNKNPIDAMQNREEIFGEYMAALMTCDNLLCLYGGVITIVENSDSKEETIAEETPEVEEEPALMDLETALQEMTKYLQGELSEEELNAVIDFVAAQCGLTVADMKTGEFSSGDAYARSQSYDSQIIAWTYYWNEKIENEFPNKFTIDPNIVKAIIAQESSFGDNPDQEDKNPSRNVMQSLATGNDNVWTAAGINPYDMFSLGDHIPFKKLDGTVNPNGSLPPETSGFYKNRDDEKYVEKERVRMHFEDINIIENIFETDNDGKFMLIFDNVTSNMSIAVGVGVLAEKTNSANGSEYTGVVQYNSKPGYVEDVNKYLGNMGCKLIEPE